jgi:hypothetical protein
MPALLITGYAEPDSALAPSFDVPVLIKPFDGEQLRAILSRTS